MEAIKLENNDNIQVIAIVPDEMESSATTCKVIGIIEECFPSYKPYVKVLYMANMKERGKLFARLTVYDFSIPKDRNPMDYRLTDEVYRTLNTKLFNRQISNCTAC